MTGQGKNSMRSYRHWTPRYIKSRFVTLYHERAFPNYPWLTHTTNVILNFYLRGTDVGLEFGSGRSTQWFAKRIGFLTSVEHDPIWAAKVQKILTENSINNVEYKLISKDKEENQAYDAAYVKVIETFAPNSLDFCLVDGIYRDFCALRATEKICPGGILVIDNVNWYLPSGSYSPDSRTFHDGPQGPIWKEVDQILSNWRRIWTSSGVTDTAIFFKPCS
jgi:hypothetical protein